MSNTKTKEMSFFLHRKADGEESLAICDMTICYSTKNILPEMVDSFGVCLGQVSALVQYESPECDIHQVLIESIESSIEQERASSQMRINSLLEKLSQLQCLTIDSE